LGFLVRKYATLVWYHKCLGANGSWDWTDGR
jgi:hypothetical protein